MHPRSALFLVVAMLVAVTATPTLARASPTEDVEAGKAAAAKGKWSEAADLYAKATEAEETNRLAILGLARASVQARRKDLYKQVIDLLYTHVDTDEGDNDYEALIRLGQVIYADGGDCSDEYEMAHDRLDKILQKSKKPPAEALFWKGHAFFDQAMHCLRDPARKAEAPRLLRKAQGVLLASTRVNDKSFEAIWLTARVSEHLEDHEASIEAYAKAAALRPDLMAPLQGISTLLRSRDPKRYEDILQGLLARNEKHPQALYFLGLHRMEGGLFEEAQKLLVEVTELDPSNADAFNSLGMTLALAGEEEDAVKMFKRALRADSDHAAAAEQIDRRLRSPRVERRASRTPEAALAAAKAYDELLQLAPNNPFVRNNIGYLLRKGWRKHKTDAAWRPILEECAKHYKEASRLIGPWSEDLALSAWTDAKAANPTWRRLWQRNYAYGQILCDTGGISVEAPDLEGFEQAEEYYIRCLNFSGYAYYDGWLFLGRILERKARWKELGELAERCAVNLRTEDGKPHPTGRKAAAERLAQLEKDGFYKKK